MAWGMILSAAGSIIGANQQAGAATEALDYSNWAQGMGTEAQRQMFEEGMEFGAPYREAGQEALGYYGQQPMGVQPSDLYALEQGEQALRAGQSARGRRRSGSSARELTDFYGNVFSDIYNRDYGGQLERANLGAQFAGASGQAAQNTGQGVASTYMQGAAQQVPYILGQGQMGASQIAAGAGMAGGIIDYYGNTGGGGAGGGYGVTQGGAYANIPAESGFDYGYGE